MFAFFKRIKNWDSHHRLIAATAVAALVAVATRGRLHIPMQLVAIWNAFSLSVLAQAWLRIVTARPRESLKTAKLQDSSQRMIFLFVVLAACVSLFAVGYLLGTAHGKHGGWLLGTIAVACGTVTASWLLIHTVFALHYAHIYYGDDPTRPGSHVGGVKFPDERTPDYLDFAYFSFVVGTTCQVSDVQVSGRRMRRLVLIHGLLSFAFNTILLALSINVVSGLIAG